MSRYLKILGPTVLAVLAITAIGPSNAAASGERFHVAQAHTLLHVHGTIIVIQLPSGKVTCNTFTGDATTTEVTPSELTLTGISLSACSTETIFGTINVTVDFKGCHWLLTADTGQPWHIQCPAGLGPITITGPGCTMTIGAQTLNGLTYTNGASDVTAHANVSNIHSNATGFFCSSTGTSTTGTLKATATMKGATTAGAAVTVSYG